MTNIFFCTPFLLCRGVHHRAEETLTTAEGMKELQITALDMFLFTFSLVEMDLMQDDFHRFT